MEKNSFLSIRAGMSVCIIHKYSHVFSIYFGEVIAAYTRKYCQISAVILIRTVQFRQLNMANVRVHDLSKYVVGHIKFDWRAFVQAIRRRGQLVVD